MVIENISTTICRLSRVIGVVSPDLWSGGRIAYYTTIIADVRHERLLFLTGNKLNLVQV